MTGDSAVFQPVTVPISASNPTLSFLHQLGGASSVTATWLSVRVGDGLTATTLLSTSANTERWTHRWFDLTPWVSRTVTVTFNVHQTEGLPPTWAYIDEVTVGSAYPDVWVGAGDVAALPGEQTEFPITYGNRGGAPASDVRVTGTLPADLFFVAADPSPITTTPALAWDAHDLPAKSGPFSIVVTATMAPTATMWSNHTSTARIGSASTELELHNNEVRARVFVGRWVHLPIVVRSP
jgi:uncharacterized repeat protein (TIGR01451 family)